MIRKIFFFALLAACSALHAQQIEWNFDKGPYFARIHDFAVGVKNGVTILYAADSSENSLLKSTDRGDTWTHVLGVGTGVYVRCVATVGNNPDIVYAGVPYSMGGFEAGVHKSTDGGETWTHLDDPQLTNRQVIRIAIHPTQENIVWVGCLEGTISPRPRVVYRSTNGGNNWEGGR